MKPMAWVLAGALATTSVTAWGQAQSNAITGTPAPSGAPAPIVIETKVDLRTEPGPPADQQAAREEAAAALQWARAEGCRADPAPRECLRRAQEEYRAVMGRSGQR